MFNSYRSRQNVSLCLWELGEDCFIHYYCLWCYESFLFVMFFFSFFLNPSRQFQLSFVEYFFIIFLHINRARNHSNS